MSRKLSLAVLVLIILIVNFSLNAWCSSLSFSPDIWKKTEEAQRYLFVDDLLNRRLLIGKNRAEVVEMLGEPSDKPSNNSDVYYIIKLGGDYFVLVRWLEIKFHPGNGLVSDVKIASD